MSDTYTRVLGMLDRPTAVFRPRVLVTALRTRPVSVDRGPAPPASVPAPRTPAEQAEVRA
jgi:hypothetical protein